MIEKLKKRRPNRIPQVICSKLKLFLDNILLIKHFATKDYK